MGFLHYSLAAISQNDLKYISDNLDVRYDVLDNLQDDKNFQCRMNLTNTGSKTIDRGPWAIYFNYIRKIEPTHITGAQRGYTLKKYGVKFVHISGSLFKVEPVQGFQPLSPGKSLEIVFYSEHFSVARTDVMPNWYVAAEGLQAVNIGKTTDEDLGFVGPFDTKEKWKRKTFDVYNPFTPQERFERILADDKKSQVTLTIIPTPVEMAVQDDKNTNIERWVIIASKQFQNEAKYLGEKLHLKVQNNSGNIPKSKMISFLQRNITVNVNGRNSQSKERYILNVSSSQDIITIEALEPSGAFYGVQSLLAIMDQDSKQVPKVFIKDAPRYDYRGIMVDISRNFHGKNSTLKLMDAMAMYKMNKLHLHLSDDEGWRLEIPGLEELTRFGGQRCHDTNICLAPQLGSGATMRTSGTGYLSIDDYKEILKHAKKLHIEVIPEFDMPGHSHASIKAMEYRFTKYNSSTNKTVRGNAGKFLLSEPGDTSEYLSIQLFRDNALNPCLDSTYDFVEHILVNLIEIHKDISPLNVFHMGGDEVAKGAWLNSSACQNLISQNSRIASVKDLKEYFVGKLSNITSKYHVDLAAWEDGLIQEQKVFNRTNLPNSNVFSYAWDNVWEWGAFNRAYLLANSGYKNVMCQATHLYFDMPYEPDPEERGYYWATRYIDTQKTFGFMPDDLYANAKVDRFGNPYEICKTQSACPTLNKPSNIVGMQAHLWSETVRTENELFYMLFPRVLAAAERSWHKASFENENNVVSRNKMRNLQWETFANILGYRELSRLDDMKINYRIPLPGAKVEGGKLVAKSAFPGLKIEYKTDDQNDWQEYTSELKVKGKLISLRTKAANSKRSSREIVVDIPNSSGNCASIMMSFLLAMVFIGISAAF